jgi:hypothetical protein
VAPAWSCQFTRLRLSDNDLLASLKLPRPTGTLHSCGTTNRGLLSSGNQFARSHPNSNSAHEDKQISYLQKEASALYQQGDELCDNGALLSALERYTGWLS